MAYGIIKQLITTLAVLVTLAATSYFSYVGRNKVTKIRAVPGLKAVDDAIGRATEMGKPLLFTTLHGSGSGNSAFVQSSGPAHLAGLSVLGYVAKEIAKRDAKLEVPLAWPDVAEMGVQVVDEAYRSEGKIAPPNTVQYISSTQMAYATGTAGVMARTQPASILMFGPAAAETLILAESANKFGSFNIGASAANQAVYFIVSCDYVMIGEELYIAGAYLSQDKIALGSIKGQDYPKFSWLAFFIIAEIMAIMGIAYRSTVLGL